MFCKLLLLMSKNIVSTVVLIKIIVLQLQLYSKLGAETKPSETQRRPICHMGCFSIDSRKIRNFNNKLFH